MPELEELMQLYNLSEKELEYAQPKFEFVNLEGCVKLVIVHGPEKYLRIYKKGEGEETVERVYYIFDVYDLSDHCFKTLWIKHRSLAAALGRAMKQLGLRDLRKLVGKTLYITCIKKRREGDERVEYSYLVRITDTPQELWEEIKKEYCKTLWGDEACLEETESIGRIE